MAAGCGSSNSTGSSQVSTGGPASCTTTVPGVTTSTITIGDLLPLSGAGVSQRAGWNSGVSARISALSASGGVNGRQVTVIDEDDKSTAAGSLDSAKDLVENKGVFAILQQPLENGAGAYLQTAGVPVVAGATADVGAKYSNYVSPFGATIPGTGSTSIADFLKSQGASKVAVLSVADPQALSAEQLFTKAAGVVGLNIGLTKLDIPFVPGDFTAVAQSMKSAGVDATSMAITNNVAIALYKAALQAGVQFKAYTFPNFYDPTAVKQVGASLDGSFTGIAHAPFELHLPATDAFVSAMGKYAPTAAVNTQAFQGWLAADYTIQILKQLGSCPSRTGFLSAIKSFTWDGNGAIGSTIKYHQPNLCSWFAKITASGYVPVGNKPVCGQAVQG